MIEVRQTLEFRAWLGSLPDRRAVDRIVQRIVRLEGGNFGDVKSVGNKVGELRIDYGPGYRLYFSRRGTTVVILLCGGSKRTQRQDVKIAVAMAQELAE